MEPVSRLHREMRLAIVALYKVGGAYNVWKIQPMLIESFQNGASDRLLNERRMKEDDACCLQ